MRRRGLRAAESSKVDLLHHLTALRKYGACMRRALLVAIVSCVLMVSGCGTNQKISTDEAAIRSALEEWPQAFNAKNAARVCDLFAHDAILSYPGTQDRNYETMCQQFTILLNRTDRIIRYDPPAIEHIEVSGDIGVVRLVWTSRISDSSTSTEVVEREKGIDIFKKQRDGKWKIRISFAYPLQ